jgi:hypothetical protein
MELEYLSRYTKNTQVAKFYENPSRGFRAAVAYPEGGFGG